MDCMPPARRKALPSTQGEVARVAGNMSHHRERCPLREAFEMEVTERLEAEGEELFSTKAAENKMEEAGRTSCALAVRGWRP